MQLRTEIENMPSQQRIGCRDGILILGSCFADNIGSWLEESCLDVCNNPFGVLYNPLSIASSLQMLIDRANGQKSQDKRIFKANDGLWYSYDFHGRYCAQNEPELDACLDEVLENASASLSKSKHLIITFGTSWVYEKDGAIVANCHKMPAKEFTRRRLPVKEIVETWEALIKSMDEDKHILFTVSPIRHVKDTLHGNQISKSTLMLAIDELCVMFPGKVEYVPSYELLIDDLRDYRFYNDDLVHPSPLAVEIVRQYFVENYLDKECSEFLREVEPLMKAAHHRPLHPESEAHRAFKCQNNLKIDQLQEKYSIFGLAKLKV